MVDSQSIVNDPAFVPLAVSSTGSAADVIVFRVDDDGTFLIVSSTLRVRRLFNKRNPWRPVRQVRD
jgi:hypothetical protein